MGRVGSASHLRSRPGRAGLPRRTRRPRRFFGGIKGPVALFGWLRVWGRCCWGVRSFHREDREGFWGWAQRTHLHPVGLSRMALPVGGEPPRRPGAGHEDTLAPGSALPHGPSCGRRAPSATRRWAQRTHLHPVGLSRMALPVGGEPSRRPGAGRRNNARRPPNQRSCQGMLVLRSVPRA